MPSFLKFDGVDGESSDSFVFNTKKTDGSDDFGTKDVDDAMAGLLLPAVQRGAFMAEEEPMAMKGRLAMADEEPMALVEELSMNYTEIEWTY